MSQTTALRVMVPIYSLPETLVATVEPYTWLPSSAYTPRTSDTWPSVMRTRRTCLHRNYILSIMFQRKIFWQCCSFAGGCKKCESISTYLFQVDCEGKTIHLQKAVIPSCKNHTCDGRSRLRIAAKDSNTRKLVGWHPIQRSPVAGSTSMLSTAVSTSTSYNENGNCCYTALLLMLQVMLWSQIIYGHRTASISQKIVRFYGARTVPGRRQEESYDFFIIF